MDLQVGHAVPDDDIINVPTDHCYFGAKCPNTCGLHYIGIHSYIHCEGLHSTPSSLLLIVMLTPAWLKRSVFMWAYKASELTLKSLSLCLTSNINF